MNEKAEKFRSRFLQVSLGQFLTTMGVYEQLLETLSEADIDKLLQKMCFSARHVVLLQ